MCVPIPAVYICSVDIFQFENKISPLRIKYCLKKDMILDDSRPAFSVSAGENVNVSSLCQLGALPVYNGCSGNFCPESI